MVKRIALVLWLLLLSLAVIAEPATIKILKTQFEYDVRHDYYTSLLQKALIKGAGGREVPQLQETTFMTQGRAAY